MPDLYSKALQEQEDQAAQAREENTRTKEEQVPAAAANPEEVVEKLTVESKELPSENELQTCKDLASKIVQK